MATVSSALAVQASAQTGCDRSSSPERDAILEGLRAADDALERFRESAVLQLFVGARPSPRAAPKLEALRAYAELRRVLLFQGHFVPTTSLSEAGFTVAQIAQFDAIFVEALPASRRRPAASDADTKGAASPT